MRDIETDTHAFYVSGIKTHNCNDVRLVDRIEAKRKLIELQLVVAYHAKINHVDVLSQVKMWDTNIVNHLLEDGVVVPQKGSPDKTTQFTGAYVMTPIVGMHEWICSFDVQSLYPTIMRTLNMGMETKVPHRELTPEMRRYQTYISSHLMTPDHEGKLNVNPQAIIDGLTDDLMTHFKEQNVAVGANGVFYRRDPKSFYSVMIEEMFYSCLEF
jgi:DNA polymerase elongation subunit (family B)